jgi:hypothetical protein
MIFTLKKQFYITKDEKIKKNIISINKMGDFADKAFYFFFILLGLTILILGAVVKGSMDTANKQVTSPNDEFKTAETNISKSSIGLIIIGVIIFLFSVGMFYGKVTGKHNVGLAGLSSKMQGFKKYYF